MASTTSSLTFGKSTFNIPAIHEGQPLSVSNGLFQATFKTVVISLTYRDIASGPNRLVPDDHEYVEATRNFGFALTPVTENIVVETSDGMKIFWFVKKA